MSRKTSVENLVTILLNYCKTEEERDAMYSLLKELYERAQDNVLRIDKEGFEVIGENHDVTFDEAMAGHTVTSKFNTR